MTPDRIAYYLFGLVALLIAVLLIIWIVNELDEETADAAAIRAAYVWLD